MATFIAVNSSMLHELSLQNVIQKSDLNSNGSQMEGRKAPDASGYHNAVTVHPVKPKCYFSEITAQVSGTACRLK